MWRSPVGSQADPREGQGQAQGLGGDEVPDNNAQFEGSDIVNRNTRVISQNLIEILSNSDAPQWDDGWVPLADGYRFRLWSNTNPEPTEREHENMEDFTARQRAARRDRITLLANRA